MKNYCEGSNRSNPLGKSAAQEQRSYKHLHGEKIHSQEADISVKINIRPDHTRSPN
jgi:hypothetical protein